MIRISEGGHRFLLTDTPVTAGELLADATVWPPDKAALGQPRR